MRHSHLYRRLCLVLRCSPTTHTLLFPLDRLFFGKLVQTVQILLNFNLFVYFNCSLHAFPYILLPFFALDKSMNVNGLSPLLRNHLDDVIVVHGQSSSRFRNCWLLDSNLLLNKLGELLDLVDCEALRFRVLLSDHCGSHRDAFLLSSMG